MSLRIRHLAEVNPATPEFDRVSPDEHVTFMPLEAVWADNRLDLSRTRAKSDVATGYTRFRDGDVLVPKVTPTFQAGRSTVVRDLRKGVGAGSTELHVLRPKSGVDARFLRYVVMSAPFLSEGITAFQGVAGLQRVPDEFVREFPVVEFSLEEQRRIADFLDAETNRIGKLIGMRTRQLELIESRSKCQLAKVLLPPIPPASWREIPIKYLFEFERAGVWGDDPAGDKSDVLCVRVADFDRISLTGGSTAATYRAIDAQQIRRRALRKGDVLLEKSGGGEKNPVGFAVNYDGPENVLATTSNFVSILRPKSNVFPRFAGLLMAANYFAGMNIPFIKQTTGIQNLDSAGYLGRKVHLPTISEQVSIVRLLDRNLDSASRYRNSAKHQIDLLAERRQALITAAVTGQLDVTTARSGVR